MNDSKFSSLVTKPSAIWLALSLIIGGMVGVASSGYAQVSYFKKNNAPSVEVNLRALEMLKSQAIHERSRRQARRTATPKPKPQQIIKPQQPHKAMAKPQRTIEKRSLKQARISNIDNAEVERVKQKTTAPQQRPSHKMFKKPTRSAVPSKPTAPAISLEGREAPVHPLPSSVDRDISGSQPSFWGRMKSMFTVKDKAVQQEPELNTPAINTPPMLKAESVHIQPKSARTRSKPQTEVRAKQPVRKLSQVKRVREPISPPRSIQSKSIGDDGLSVPPLPDDIISSAEGLVDIEEKLLKPLPVVTSKKKKAKKPVKKTHKPSKPKKEVKPAKKVETKKKDTPASKQKTKPVTAKKEIVAPVTLKDQDKKKRSPAIAVPTTVQKEKRAPVIFTPKTTTPKVIAPTEPSKPEPTLPVLEQKPQDIKAQPTQSQVSPPPALKAPEVKLPKVVESENKTPTIPALPGIEVNQSEKAAEKAAKIEVPALATESKAPIAPEGVLPTLPTLPSLEEGKATKTVQPPVLPSLPAKEGDSKSIEPASNKPEESKPVVKEPVNLAPEPAFNAKNFKQGLLLQIIYPTRDTSVPLDFLSKLDDLAISLANDPSKRITIVSYASNVDDRPSSSRRISLQRAIVVRKQIIEKKIDSKRINVQALGDKIQPGTPADRIDIMVANGGQ